MDRFCKEICVDLENGGDDAEDTLADDVWHGITESAAMVRNQQNVIG